MITNEELINMIDDEGIDYVLCHKINIIELDDPKTYDLAAEAYESMSKLEEYLRDKTGIAY